MSPKSHVSKVDIYYLLIGPVVLWLGLVIIIVHLKINRSNFPCLVHSTPARPGSYLNRPQDTKYATTSYESPVDTSTRVLLHPPARVLARSHATGGMKYGIFNMAPLRCCCIRYGLPVSSGSCLYFDALMSVTLAPRGKCGADKNRRE